MSRYLITHILDGEVGKFCQEISNEVAQKFSIADAHQRIPPHLTLKAPFEADTDSITDVESILESIANRFSLAPITISGFSHFNQRVIYLDVFASPEVRTVSNALTERLQTLPWMSFSHHDTNITFHATLARAESPNQCENILSYLRSTYRPNNEVAFDNISLLQKHEDNEWKIQSQYKIKK